MFDEKDLSKVDVLSIVKLLVLSNILCNLFVVMIGLTACGSGGGDNGGGTPTPVGTSVSLVPFKNVFLGTSAGAQYNFPALFGTDSQGRSWSGSFTVVADGATVFETPSVTKSRTLVTMQLTGGTPVSIVVTSYFMASDGSPYKSISNTGETETSTSQIPLPVTAKVGDFGDFGITSGSDGTVTTSIWALNAGSNRSSILTVSAIEKTDGTITSNQVESYYLDATGVPTKFAVIEMIRFHWYAIANKYIHIAMLCNQFLNPCYQFTCLHCILHPLSYVSSVVTVAEQKTRWQHKYFNNNNHLR